MCFRINRLLEAEGDTDKSTSTADTLLNNSLNITVAKTILVRIRRLFDFRRHPTLSNAGHIMLPAKAF
jgi:hypothetical protein